VLDPAGPDLLRAAGLRVTTPRLAVLDAIPAELGGTFGRAGTLVQSYRLGNLAPGPNLVASSDHSP
jgi:hypothetical protein